MTVYFMGTELEDFPDRAGTVTHGTISTFRRTANTRCSISMTGAAEDARYIETDALSSSDFWTQCVYAQDGAGGANNIVKWYSGGTQKLAFHWLTAATGQVELRKWNGSSWDSLGTATDSAYVMGASVLVVLNFYIKLGNPGEFRVYVNNIPAISLNTLDLSGIGAIDKIRLQPGVTSGALFCSFSEVIVADYNTIGSKIVLRPPTGNGSYQEWTNGGFAVVDDQNATGADLAVSGTAGQRTTYTHAAFTALASNEALAAVKVSAAVNRDAAGPQNINFMTRIGSTDYNGADKALNVTQTRIGQIWETSPATAAAWTIAELNAAHMGVRSRT